MINSGQTFELGDEMAGLVGFRAVPLNPERSLNFKIADYQKGVRDSRSLFTAKSLRGGPIRCKKSYKTILMQTERCIK